VAPVAQWLSGSVAVAQSGTLEPVAVSEWQWPSARVAVAQGGTLEPVHPIPNTPFIAIRAATATVIFSQNAKPQRNGAPDTRGKGRKRLIFGVLSAIFGVFEVIFGVFGTIFGVFEVIFGVFGTIFGVFGVFRAIFDVFRAIFGIFSAIFGIFGRFYTHFGEKIERKKGNWGEKGPK
jgi:hypothetical protein